MKFCDDQPPSSHLPTALWSDVALFGDDDDYDSGCDPLLISIL